MKTLFPACALVTATLHAGPPVYTVPELSRPVVIDGQAGDWLDQGLVIPTLLDADNETPPGGFSASARIAWDKEGMCVLVETRGGTGNEADNPGALFKGAGIELFASPSHFSGGPQVSHQERNIFQPTLASGRDPRFISMRSYAYDYRLSALVSSGPVAYPHAASHQADASTYEIRLPWSLFALEAKPGMLFGLQIHVNDADQNGRCSQLRWNPEAGKGMALRLIPASGHEARVPAVATAKYEAYQNIRVRVSAAAGELALVGASGSTLAKARADQNGDATFITPIPEWGKPSEALSINDATGCPVAWVELPDATKFRRDSARALPVTFAGDNVFSATDFPEPEFSDRSFANLIDPDTVRVRYFNRSYEETAKPESTGRYGARLTYQDRGGEFHTTNVTLFRSDSPIQTDANPVELAKAAELSEPLTSDDLRMIESARDHAFSNWQQRVFGRAITLAALHERGSSPARAMSADLNWWYHLECKLGATTPVRHLDLLPKDYDDDPQKHWPVVVFLHGSGGHSESSARTEPIRNYWEKRDGPPFILLQPLAPGGRSWVPDQIIEWLEETLPRYRADQARIVLTGFSMGGIGTWNIGCLYPGRFAAFIPVAGTGELAPVTEMKGRPIWVFHGSQDAMPMAPAKVWADELKSLDSAADVRFTALEGIDHTNTPQAVYQRQDLYDWIRNF